MTMAAVVTGRGVGLFLFLLICFLGIGKGDDDVEGINKAGIHVVALIDEETEAKESEDSLLFSTCRLGYPSVKIIKQWCSKGSCDENLRLKEYLQSLPSDEWAVVINPAKEVVVLMATPEDAIKKLSESGRDLIIAKQRQFVENEGKIEEENEVLDGNEDKETKIDNNIKEEESKNVVLGTLQGGTIIGRVDAILKALNSRQTPEDALLDAAGQYVLYEKRQKGGLGLQVPIETRFVPEDGGAAKATSPFVLYALEDNLDFHNIIYIGGDGPEFCPYMKTQPLPQEERKPKVLLFIDMGAGWTPFLDEVFEGLLHQDFPKDRMNVYIHAKSGVQEKEIQQFKENGSDYSSMEVVIDESVDLSSLKTKCDAMECDYLVSMDPQVLLEDNKTLSHLITANRPVIGPLLTEMKNKNSKSNFVVGTETEDQWQNLIGKQSVRGCFRVNVIRNLIVFKRDALAKIIKGEKPRHFINNERKKGYLLDFRGFKEGKLYPDLWGMRHNRYMWIRRYIHPDVLKTIKKEMKPEEVGPYLYYMPFFTERYCKEIIEEMENFGKWFDKSVDDRGEAAHRYTSRNINFEQIDYSDDYHIILNSIHKELLSSLYGNFQGVAEASLIFVLKYASAAQYGTFNYHLDGGSYTFNIALNNEFTGGGIQYKLGNENFEEVLEFTVPHNRTGWAVIQPDRPLHQHRGVPLESGTRYAMVNIIETNDNHSKGGPKWTN